MQILRKNSDKKKILEIWRKKVRIARYNLRILMKKVRNVRLTQNFDKASKNCEI